MQLSKKQQNFVTIHGLAQLMIQGKIETVRFGSDGRTAVVKYNTKATDETHKRVEKRIYPTRGEDGVDCYDVSFLPAIG